MKSIRLSFKEFRKNGGTVIRGSTECFFSIVDSRRVDAFCVENSQELMKKLGLVGAIGQLRNFHVSKHLMGGGRGHGNRETLSRKARPTEQTGSVRRK